MLDTARPRGGALGQVALLAVAWSGYSMARSLSGDNVAVAVHRGRELQQWDQRLGFGFTLQLNHWITSHGLFAVPLTFEYASLHYIVTPLVLTWLWHRHAEQYRLALYSLLAMSAAGLLVYVAFPVAPPRLLPGAGWIDTMSVWSHIGWWGGAGSAPAGFANFTDQFAAMPSLHVGWAIWCAWVWRRVGGRLVGRIGWLYPALVSVTVIVTANHYVLDVVAGAGFAAVACTLVPRLLARRSVTRGPGLLPRGAVGAAFAAGRLRNRSVSRSG